MYVCASHVTHAFLQDDMLVKGVALAEGQGRGGAIDYVKVSIFMGGSRSYLLCRATTGLANA